MTRDAWEALGFWCSVVLAACLAGLLAAVALGDDKPTTLLATCLAGEAGIKPTPDHAAILHVLHRLAGKRSRSLEFVTRGHCNASVSANGVARVEADRMRFPQDWEALVQTVEAFDTDTPNPCRGATTWGSPNIGSDVAHAKRLGLVEVVCSAPTLNRFLKAGRP